MSPRTIADVARLFSRLDRVAAPVSRAMKVARLGAALRATDPAVARAFGRKAQKLLPEIRSELRAAVDAGELTAADAARILKALDDEIARATGRTARAAAAGTLAKATAKQIRADPAEARRVAQALREVLAHDFPAAYMDELEKLLTDDDWVRLVRKAVDVDPKAASTMQGLLHELITFRSPQYRKALTEARDRFRTLFDRDGWRFVSSEELMAPGVADGPLRLFADKGAFAVRKGDPPMAVPLMIWQDKNQRNLVHLFGEDGQLLRDSKRLKFEVVKIGDKTYYVDPDFVAELPPKRYAAAPILPGRGKATEMQVVLDLKVTYAISPVPSSTLRKMSDRMLKLIPR